MSNRADREPSMEEILSSIKRIIAEDGAVQARAARTVSRPVADPLPDVPGVTTRIPGRDSAREDVLELTDDAIDEAEAAPLIADEAAESLRNSLAALATLAEPGVPPQIVRSGETSLEGLVRDLLRPMLKDWLDANLPAIVEGQVRKEIERVTRR